MISNNVLFPEINNRIIYLLLICMFFLLHPSCVLQSYLNMNSAYVYASIISLVVIYYTVINRYSIRLFGLQELILVIWILGLIGSFFSGKFSQILFAGCLILNIVFVLYAWQDLIAKKTLMFFYYLVVILLLGAIIGFIYALFGGQPLLTVFEGGPSGRELRLYLTTFTDASIKNIIRPAGIFDEPGAFATFITIFVALNEALRGNQTKSFVVLAMGLVTGSMALFIVAASFLMYKAIYRSLFPVVVFISIIIISLQYNDNFRDVWSVFYFDRVNGVEIINGKITGDNRSVQVDEFFQLVDLDLTLRGAEDRKAARDQSSNPFSIYYTHGVFTWLPYMVIELWLLYCAFFYRQHLRFPAMAMFITLLQRPYVYNLYWGLLIMLVLITIYKLQKLPFLDDLLLKQRSFSASASVDKLV